MRRSLRIAIGGLIVACSAGGPSVVRRVETTVDVAVVELEDDAPRSGDSGPPAVDPMRGVGVRHVR